jgi:hypothetical protein
VALARSKEVVHFDLERPRERWSEHATALAEEGKLPLRYRNIVGVDLLMPDQIGSSVVVVDTVGLAVPREGVHEFARTAKQYAVRQHTVVVFMVQLRRELWGQLEAGGWVNPKEFPEWVLEFADQIHLVRRTGAGMAVHRVKSDVSLWSRALRTLLRSPKDACTLQADSDGRLTQTG